MLTIGQLAAYAGVTVRTVRHYHARGLLPEPERDHSGYRRYDAAAVVALIRIRTLAEAGVPLARVGELLDADDDLFAAAVADLDRKLQAEVRRLQRHRRRISQLAAGDSLALPPAAVAYLDRLASLGLPRALIDAERDAWILVAAQLPEQMPVFMALKQAQLDNPAVLGLYRDLADAITWRPDDPRVEAVADRIVDLLEQDHQDVPAEEHQQITEELAALLDAVFLDSVPIARPLLRRLEQRGWTGWTNTRRIAST